MFCRKEAFNIRSLNQLFTVGEGVRARAPNFFPRRRSPSMETEPFRRNKDAWDAKTSGAVAQTPPPQPGATSLHLPPHGLHLQGAADEAQQHFLGARDDDVQARDGCLLAHASLHLAIAVAGSAACA